MFYEKEKGFEPIGRSVMSDLAQSDESAFQELLKKVRPSGRSTILSDAKQIIKNAIRQKLH